MALIFAGVEEANILASKKYAPCDFRFMIQEKKGNCIDAETYQE